jgi:hypothetical protein
VDNIQKFQNGGTIIGNSGGVLSDHLIHTSGAEGGTDNLNDSVTGIDVGDDLRSSL